MIRLYRALLRLYPASFRAEYGEEMCAIFARRLRDTSGLPARLALWFSALADVLPNALRAHWDILRQDLRYTGRTLRRSPGFTATAVLISALGVGAVTAAFSITDHVLIRPLPFPDAERLALPIPKYAPTERRAQFYTRVLSDVRGLPGVSSASYISFLPMVMRGGIWSVTLDGQPEDAANRAASLRFVTPGFFETLGIPIRLGRDVSETDSHGAPFVAVVSDSFAKQYWPGQNPLGRRFKFGFHDRTVVGVVGDIKVRGLETSSEPQVYLSCQQADDGDIIGYVPKDLVIRASGSPSALLPAIRGIVSRADPEIPVSDVRPLTDIVRAETAPRRVQAWVLGAFAGIAFLLAGIGIHGLLAFTVSQRIREIGVRMAMGAQPADILKMVMRQGVVLASIGVGLGVVLAYAAGRAMQALLAGVSPADAATFLSAVALSVLMTLVGSLLPAIRAVRVNPMTVIRSE